MLRSKILEDEVLGDKVLRDKVLEDEVLEHDVLEHEVLEDKVTGNKISKNSHVIKTLINNLPLLHIKFPGISIFIDVVCFLNDPDIIIEFMKLTHKPEPSPSESKDSELHAQDIPVSQRKSGSGRPRIIKKRFRSFYHCFR